jgi:hypothetical protein
MAIVSFENGSNGTFQAEESLRTPKFDLVAEYPYYSKGEFFGQPPKSRIGSPLATTSTHDNR